MLKQNPPDGGFVLADDAVIAGKAGGLLGDHAKTGRVMVPSGDERGPRRRAQGGGVNVVIAQTVIRDAIHRRRRDDATEGARNTKSSIIRDDEQHIGSTLGWHDARCPLHRYRLDLDAPDSVQNPFMAKISTRYWHSVGESSTIIMFCMVILKPPLLKKLFG